MFCLLLIEPCHFVHACVTSRMKPPVVSVSGTSEMWCFLFNSSFVSLSPLFVLFIVCLKRCRDFSNFEHFVFFV